MGAGKIESKHHILSLKLSAFETRGQVTTICTNKIGILTKIEKTVIEFQLVKDVVKDDTSLDMVGDLLKLLQQAVGLNKIGIVHITSCILHHDLHRLKTQKTKTLFLLFLSFIRVPQKRPSTLVNSKWCLPYVGSNKLYGFNII